MTDTLPLFPLNSVLLPGGSLPLRVFEKRYRDLVNDLCEQVVPDFLFGVVAIRQGWEVGTDNVDAMYDVGCSARLSKITSLPAEQYDVTATGQHRFRLLQIDHQAAPYLMARVAWLPDTPPEKDSPERRSRITEAARRAHREYRANPKGTIGTDDSSTSAEDSTTADEPSINQLSYDIADSCVLSMEDRQDVLAETDPLLRLRLTGKLVRRETYFQHQLGAIPAPFTDFAQQSSDN